MTSESLNTQLREGIVAALKVQWPNASVLTLSVGAPLLWPRPEGEAVVHSSHRTIWVEAGAIDVMARRIADLTTSFLVDPAAVAIYIGGAFVFETKAFVTIQYIERETPTCDS